MLCSDGSRHELRQVEADHKLRVAGFVFSGTLLVWECPHCRLRHVDGADLERFDAAVARALVLSSVLTPEALRFMREAIGATREQLAAELEAPHSTVLRWESGRAAVPPELIGKLARMVLARTDRADVPRIQMRELARTNPVKVRGFKAASGQ